VRVSHIAGLPQCGQLEASVRQSRQSFPQFRQWSGTSFGRIEAVIVMASGGSRF
jgi:hypothetical protein